MSSVCDVAKLLARMSAARLVQGLILDQALGGGGGGSYKLAIP
jgi:hypothetical protein